MHIHFVGLISTSLPSRVALALGAALRLLDCGVEDEQDGQGVELPAPELGEEPEAPASRQPRLVRLEPLGVYPAGPAGVGAAEIVAFDPQSARLFVTNPGAGGVDVVDLAEPSAPVLIDRIDVRAYGGAATSVDVAGGLLAITAVATPAQEPGTLLLLRAADLAHLDHLQVGALPDMVTFTPDGSALVVACEGEPSEDYAVDPPGQIAVVNLRGGVSSLGEVEVRYAGFEAFERGGLDPRVRIDCPSSSVAADLEPEFVAISADSRTAWVSLQENNALALVDLESSTVTEIVGLGELPQPRLLGLHGSATHPVFGLRQPDAIARFRVDGRDYLVSANEGDCRRYAAHHELAQLRDLRLDPVAFPDAAELQRDEVLGRLAVSSRLGDTDDDGDYDELHSCGSRSISVWTAAGELVWDSGALLDQLTAASLGDAEIDEGPGPEGVVTAELWGRPYAFVGLERAGGIAVFELSTPSDPRFVVYENSTGDLGPEGLEFVAAEDSPTGEPLLIVANELSRLVRIYRVVGE